MPSLWMDIWLQPGGWPQEFLRRSRDCNLRHVAFFPSDGRRKRRRQRDDGKLLAADTHRLEYLYLCGDLVHRFFAHDAGPAPHLWSLYLTTCDLSGHSGSSFVIPPTAFAGAVPFLRDLTLEPVPPRLAPLTGNLKHLTLSRGDTLTEPRCPRFLPLLDLLAVLRRMPSLSTLTADDVLTEPLSASALETALDALPPVWLPQLQYLKLHTPWLANYRTFMQMVEYDYVPARWDMGTTLTTLEAHQPALLPYDITTFSVPGGAAARGAAALQLARARGDRTGMAHPRR